MIVPKNIKVVLNKNVKGIYDYFYNLKDIYSSIDPFSFYTKKYMFIGQNSVTFSDSEEYFQTCNFSEAFFFKDRFLLKCNSSQEKSKEKSEEMTTEINYTDDWYMDCPNIKEEWDVFVAIMTNFGVRLTDKDFKGNWRFVGCNTRNSLSRHNILKGRKVSLLEAIVLLQRPVQQEKAETKNMEELVQTIQWLEEELKHLKDLKNNPYGF